MEREAEAKTTELRASREGPYTVLDSVDAAVYVSDMEARKNLFANKYLRDLFGDVVGELCWQVLQAGQSGPCAFSTNDGLLDTSGEPSGAYEWEFQDTANGRWYEIFD